MIMGLLVFVLAIAFNVSHSRGLGASRKEDPAAGLTPDRISSRTSPTAMEECKPLIGEHSVRDTMVPDLGLYGVARENRTLTHVADEAETDSLGGNVEGRGHCQEMAQ